jgi:GT2 family glycosyltransferase
MVMASIKPNVIAVICHYNMVDTLERLLKQVTEQNYDQIYVLDDASTDRSIETLIQRYPNVMFELGTKNRGPGGNRNRILEVSTTLPTDSILHFLDADVTLTSQATPTVLRKLFKDSTNKLIGGLITTPDNKQMIFNYGPRLSLYGFLGGYLVVRLKQLSERSPAKAERFYARYHYFLSAWPNILKPAANRSVFWVAEANFAVPYRIYTKLNGFDARLGYHEIQDLAIRLERQGVDRFTSSAFTVEHPDIKLIQASRWLKQRKAELQLLGRYGIRLK